MPTKPMKPCSYPGCPKLTYKTYCPYHKSLMNKNYNKYCRTYDVNKRYGSLWQRIRNRYVMLHPLCELCLKEGILTPVEEVHHIVPLSKGGTNDFSNLMSLCKSHHQRLHIELGDRKARYI